MGRINPVHIQGGVCFRVALPLGFGEGLGKRQTVFGHAGQDIVGRTVQDAEQGVQPIGGKPFPDGLEERDPSRYGRFKTHGAAAPRCKVKNFVSMMGQQGLVGRDHVLAPLQGFH